MVTRVLDAVYREYLVPIAEKSENDLDDQLMPILQKGTKLAVWSIGIIVALNNAGYDVGALIAGLGIGGLALAMVAKDTASNVFGGFTIFSDRPFKLHDRVKVAGFDGTVIDIGVRSTRLNTLEDRVVTIPNSTFADSAVENVSLEPSRKVVLNLGLVYDTTPEQMRRAMTILKDLAAANEAAEENVSMVSTRFERGRHPRNANRDQHEGLGGVHQSRTRLRVPDANALHEAVGVAARLKALGGRGG